MRVAQVHWTAVPVAGGVEVHCAGLHSQLCALGVATTLFSGTADADIGVYSRALEIGHGAESAEVGHLVAMLSAYDVIQWHNPQWHKPEVTREAVTALRKSGWVGKVLFDIHNVDEESGHWRFLSEPLPDRFVVHSAFVRGEVRARLPDAVTQIAPLAMNRSPGGFRLERAAPRVLLQPTRLTQWKGSHLSLSAAATLLEQGLDFAFVHAGSDASVWPRGIPAEVMERITPWRNEGRLSLVHYSPADSWGAIASADVILHPTVDRGTHGEPFSLSVAQAVICGRHVIASASGHLPALLADYEPKVLVPPGDEEALVEAMRAAVTGPLAVPGNAGGRLAAALEASFATSGEKHLPLYAGGG